MSRRTGGSCRINAVTFAPEGAYGNAGIKSVFTHGVEMGVARNQPRDTGPVPRTIFIDAYVLANPIPGRTFSYRPITLSDFGRVSKQLLSQVSEATGEIERIDVVTTLLHDGTLFYMLAVTPRACALSTPPPFGVWSRRRSTSEIANWARDEREGEPHY